MKRQALRCVLSDKARQERLLCLDSMSTIDGKTKSMAQLLENLAIAGSALVVTKGTDTQVVLAASNLKKIWTLPVEHLNALELLSRDTVIMTVEAARWVEETLANEPHGRRGAKWITGAATTEDAPVAEAPEEIPEETSGVAEPEAAAEPAAEEAAPRPRRRRAAAATTETESPDAATETPAEEETPKPATRRRRTAAATTETETETTDAAAETPADEEAPKPRTRRRRATASTTDEPAPEAEVAETPAADTTEAETPEEEA
jgi:hypothetical protein